MLRRSSHRAIHLAGLLLVGGLAAVVLCPSGAAQADPDTLVFETVGDVPIDALDLVFDSEGALWAANANEVWRLSASAWEQVSTEDLDRVLPFATDSLIGAGRGLIKRSVDDGRTWTSVHHDDGALFATPLDGPNSGLLLAGTDYDPDPATTGFAYSTDRGATWTDAEVITGTTWHPEAFAFAEILEGPHRGRLIGGAMNGLFLSDDGGRTWTESSLVENGRYLAESVVVGADGRVRAALGDQAVPGGQLYVSDDGAVWDHAHTFTWKVYLAAVPGPPEGDGALYALEGDTHARLYRSYDGSLWQQVGRLLDGTVGRAPDDIEIGPDGRLYVAVHQSGSDEEWVYRTTEPVVVSNEPIDVPTEAEGAALRVWPNPTAGTARVALTLTQPGAVRLVVYDALGREVAILADGWREAGEHTAVFDGRGLASGVYLVRASMDGQAVGQAQRLLLMK